MAGKKTRAAQDDAAVSSNQVTEFMVNLDHPRKAEIETIRAIILGADAQIVESIKWNAPSFSTSDHFATFRLQPHNLVQIVFHTGAKPKSSPRELKIEAAADLLQWVTGDRCTMTFSDLDDVHAKAAALQSIVRQWIAQI